MAQKIKAKNVEIFIFNTTSDFKPDTEIGNDITIREYLEAQATADKIKNIRKLSHYSNEISVEPQEDDVETTNYFGTNASGGQNSDVNKNINSDVDISITTDNAIDEDLNDYILSKIESATGGASAEDYHRFNMGSSSTDGIALYLKIKKQAGSTFYFKNYLIDGPESKTPKVISGNPDDVTLTNEYTFLGAKGKVFYDFYKRASDESGTAFQ